jgi:ring-1,2-phenylacetyl-CoA epoxidase subunit PaaD
MMTAEEIWRILEQVKDPEIPAVSVVELGMIRSVGVEGDQIIVTLTPTFIGCPALQMIQSEIEARLLQAGAPEVRTRLSLSPAWSSDWITSAGRDRLKAMGLAPPPRHEGQLEAALLVEVNCPYCGSSKTELKNDFGSTLCRAIYVCNACRQPFEQFKPI